MNIHEGRSANGSQHESDEWEKEHQKPDIGLEIVSTWSERRESDSPTEYDSTIIQGLCRAERRQQIKGLNSIIP